MTKTPVGFRLAHKHQLNPQSALTIDHDVALDEIFNMPLIDQDSQSIPNRDARLVLPEGTDGRVLLAAENLTKVLPAPPVLIGRSSDIETAASNANVDLSNIEIIDPRAPSEAQRLERYAEIYCQTRHQKNMGVAMRLVRKPLFFGAMMVASGDAGAVVAGAAHPTARVIEAGAMGIGLADGIHTPSSFFLMTLPDRTRGPNRHLLFADCAVNIAPDTRQLADIAIASARSAKRLLPDPPRVALLSFSTLGSAKHEQATRVREAATLAKNECPEFHIEGELQADSALSPEIALRKIATPNDVAGQANVLIFPDLNAGNIAYKLMQQLAGAEAIGPVLQGFRRPISDLSRGASVADIFNTCLLTLGQLPE